MQKIQAHDFTQVDYRLSVPYTPDASFGSFLRIVYFLHLNAGPESGVFKKVVTQVNQWRHLGNDVRVFLVTRYPAVRDALISFGLVKSNDVELYPEKRLTGLASRFRAFNALACRVVNYSPDIIYCRNDIWYPAVSNMAKYARLVIEVNSDDIGELKCQSPLNGLYNSITRDRSFNPATGLVFVSRELATLTHFTKYCKPYLVLGNGIPLSETMLLPSRSRDAPVRLVFVGQRGMPWHGLDKIVKLAAVIPEWSFHLVGIGVEDVGGAIPSNVKTWGALLYTEYLPLLAEADCAIGTLALHRKEMQEASPLKTREYLAHGLPVISGCRDTDFMEGADFLLELPNTEDNILPNTARIRAFVESWRGRRVDREKVRHLDTGEKERTRLRFFNQIVSSHANGSSASIGNTRSEF